MREKSLQTVFAQVLNIDPDIVRVKGYFFHLGGDLIKAMRLARAASDTGFIFRVANVYNKPRPNDLATFLKEVTDEKRKRPTAV